jgi:pSer/pThr/pTyr-binding forkhead associated (FHA) protein
VSELTLTLIRLGFLAVLWLFVLSAVSVIRSDMFGARSDSRTAVKPAKAPKPAKPARSRRGDRHAPRSLVVTSGPNQGQSAPLSSQPILIGRGTDAAIRLDDDYVSTRHARIAASGDQWFVEDLGSTNGTYIGSVRITQPTTITLGTQVRIGKTILELKK